MRPLPQACAKMAQEPAGISQAHFRTPILALSYGTLTFGMKTYKIP